MRRYALIILGLFALILATSSDAQQATRIDATAAAAGRGTYDAHTRFLARLQLCEIAVDKGIDPKGLVLVEQANGFTQEAMDSTMELCIAYALGLGAGVASLQPST